MVIATAKEKLTRGIVLSLTDEELELLRRIAQLEGTGPRNALRRGLRALAEKHKNELDLPDDVFADRAKGNWLPKEKPPVLMTTSALAV